MKKQKEITYEEFKQRYKARLPEEVKEGDYDAEYYIHHQIVPAVENIFEVFEITKEEIADNKKQKKLGDF